MTTWDASGNRIIVHRELGGSAGAYYLFDRSAGSIALIGRQRPEIPDSWVAEVLPVTGSDTEGLILLALGMLMLGGLAVLASRKRREDN